MGEQKIEERYVCIGSVRGWCGHRHQLVETAMKCVERDRSRCGSHGGYSDRYVYRLSDVREEGDKVWLPSDVYVRPIDTFEVV